jgi:hypothetical protein
MQLSMRRWMRCHFNRSLKIVLVSCYINVNPPKFGQPNYQNCHKCSACGDKDFLSKNFVFGKPIDKHLITRLFPKAYFMDLSINIIVIACSMKS